jgi:hypothetical protein
VLGYDIDSGGGRLVINEKEAVRVRGIFELYRSSRSLSAVVTELSRRRARNPGDQSVRSSIPDDPSPRRHSADCSPMPSMQLAKQKVYVDPAGAGDGPFQATSAYTPAQPEHLLSSRWRWRARDWPRY